LRHRKKTARLWVDFNDFFAYPPRGQSSHKNDSGEQVFANAPTASIIRWAGNSPPRRQTGRENMIHIQFPDFSGKIILLYLTDRSDEHNVVLQNAVMENQAGKLFVVGQFAEGTTTNDWATGIQTAVAWDNVEQYLVFDSIEDYFSRISLGWENTTYQ
jgi:hypothetical protein